MVADSDIGRDGRITGNIEAVYFNAPPKEIPVDR